MEIVFLGNDLEKCQQLRTDLDLTVHCVSNISALDAFLASKPNASKYLVLLTSVEFMSNLPSNIQQRVRDIYVYTKDSNDKNYQTFEDIRMKLRGLLIGQFAVQSLAFHLSGDFGFARMYAQKSIEFSKIHIQALEDLLSKLNEEDQEGIQEVG